MPATLKFAYGCIWGLAAVVLLAGVTGARAAGPADDSGDPGGQGATLKQLSLEQLGNVEVTTASKEPVKLAKTPAAIYILTNDDIRRSGVTTIPDALRLVPGVEVAQIDANKWSVGIRGFGSSLSRDVLVLIDGRSVYTTLFAGTYWNVQNVMLEDVERIEVIRGPGGTIWGPNAVNGVINIITKSAKETHGALVSVASGNSEQGATDVRYGGGNGTNFDYRVYVMGFTRSPEDHSDGQNFDDWRAGQTGFRMDWSQQDRDSFTVQGDMYTETAGESVTATSYAPPYSQTVDANAELSGGNLVARWKHTLDSGSDIQLQVYYDRTDRWEPNLAEIRNTFDIDFLHHLHFGSRNNVLWGLGARWSVGDTKTVVTGLVFTPANATDQLGSAFLQDEITLAPDRLVLTVGSKLLHTNYTPTGLEPSTRLLWTPTQRQSAWASVTHALRTPSRVEESMALLGYLGQAIGLPAFGRFNGNTHFQPEQLNAFELGYRNQIGKKFSVDVATFYDHYHDLLGEALNGAIFIEDSPAPEHIILPAEFANIFHAVAKGVEIAPDWRPTQWWRLHGSYSYVHINMEAAPGSQDTSTGPSTMGSSPQHQGVIQSSLALPKRFEFNQTYRYVSALPAQGVPSYSTMDARIAWHAAEHWEFSINGQNLLQPGHFEFAGDPGPLVGIKRSVYGRITWRQ